jgi:hypothetical protein
MCFRKLIKYTAPAVIFINLLFYFATNIFAAENTKWKTYSGAWFQISYPADFSVRPSMKSATSVKGYDSVYFISPDKSLELYVFSPQWNGNPLDIQINHDTEVLSSQDKKTNNGITTNKMIINAKDNSYQRIIIDTEDKNLNTSKIFGVKYRNQEVYEKYKGIIQKFIKSLTQLGD